MRLEQEYFRGLAKKTFDLLRSHESLFITLEAEASHFMRINAAKIRQVGMVEDAQLTLALVCKSNSELRRSTQSITLSGIAAQDDQKIAQTLRHLQMETSELPADPFAQEPKNHPSSQTEKKGQLLSPPEAPDALLSEFKNLDLVGIYSAGLIVRGSANSAGLLHWFKTESFLFDYSLYTREQRALKGLVGGDSWDQASYATRIQDDILKLELLKQQPKKLSPANYRVFLAPAAVADIVNMFSWACVSEAAIQQGESPLRKVRAGERSFSRLFNLTENFENGSVPRWNEEGELAPVKLPIIAEGRLANTLVSQRTMREYQIPANGATVAEGLRSPCIEAGQMAEKDILKELDTGIYISNLHYLNWSDHSEGRITGMTRYACFWAEKGKLICPIENIRFDDTIFRLLGSELAGLTSDTASIPDTSTYGMRALGSQNVPGMLISNMRFTL
jgi:predicted Zn-dependent protease